MNIGAARQSCLQPFALLENNQANTVFKHAKGSQLFSQIDLLNAAQIATILGLTCVFAVDVVQVAAPLGESLNIHAWVSLASCNDLLSPSILRVKHTVL